MLSTSALPSASGAGRNARTAAPSRLTTLAASAAAALLGLTLLWGVGFSHLDAVHNAAHDARHSAGFPCH